jgi:hypothetical protein
MTAKTKLTLTAAGIALAACLIAAFSFLYFFQAPGKEAASARPGVKNWGATIPLAKDDPFIDHMVREFQKYYGDTISDKATQAGILGLREFIVGTRPADGLSVFYTILKRAFPAYADEIMDTLAKLDEYNRWLVENRGMLLKMSPDERSAAMWKKRYELFGDAAERIWKGDMLATEARKAQMKDTLDALNESDGTGIQDKFQVYQSALRATYKESPEAFILAQPDMLSRVFFSIDAVQEELKNMTPEERQQTINGIRREMGCTEEEIAKLSARDADNERRWQVGYQYMEKREAVVQQYQGEEQEEKLAQLREQFFGSEADTIAREEKDSFFRFQRPRIYGRN